MGIVEAAQLDLRLGGDGTPISPRARPFLKWAGGKTQLLGALTKLVPSRFDRYIEPFVGGGALFFCLGPSPAVLSDSNLELIHCYRVVRDSPQELLCTLGEMSISKEYFYELREVRPESLDPVMRAARLVYLNKTCYNGLYRVNKRGRFNVPFGGQTSVRLADPGHLLKASRLLKQVDLRCEDYHSLLRDTVHEGDFVYLDPPYLPLGGHSDFKRYTRDFFYEADHRHLAALFAELSARGAFLLLSNAYHPAIKQLYQGFTMLEVQASRQINCKAERRGRIKELLILNYAVEIAA